MLLRPQRACTDSPVPAEPWHCLSYATGRRPAPCTWLISPNQQRLQTLMDGLNTQRMTLTGRQADSDYLSDQAPVESPVQRLCLERSGVSGAFTAGCLMC